MYIFQKKIEIVQITAQSKTDILSVYYWVEKDFYTSNLEQQKKTRGMRSRDIPPSSIFTFYFPFISQVSLEF